MNKFNYTRYGSYTFLAGCLFFTKDALKTPIRFPYLAGCMLFNIGSTLFIVDTYDFDYNYIFDDTYKFDDNDV